MSVKGATQHRVLARALDLYLDNPVIAPHERESAKTLRRRADLGLDRIKRRKKMRALIVERNADASRGAAERTAKGRG